MNNPTLLTFIPYLIGAFVLLMAAGFRSWRVHDRNIDNLAVAIFMLCSALVAGAVDLGTDAAGYRSTYDDLLGYDTYTGWWEPGFEYVARLFASLGAPYGLFAFACVLLSNGIVLYVFRKATPNSALSFFVLFCFNLGQIAFVRQDLAASFVFLGFYLLTKRRFVFGILAIVVAALIHKTALLAGAIVFIAFYGAAAVLPLAFLIGGITIALVAIPSSITQGITQRLFEQLAVYTASGYVQGLDSEDIAFARNLIKFAFYFVFIVWMLRVPGNETINVIQKQAGKVVLVLAGISILMIVFVSPVFSRLSAYAFPFIALASRVERFRPTSRQFAGQWVAVVLLLINVVAIIYPMADAY
jgi:EpsG family